MKVDNPRFELSGNHTRKVRCEDCPFADRRGVLLVRHCGSNYCTTHCPQNLEKYAEACRLADEANGA